MKIEPLSMADPIDDHQETAISNSLEDSVNVDEGRKVQRLPRWTRQENLILIQGKRVAESRLRRGRAGLEFGSVEVQTKWSSVSSYCRKHGVNRGPVQCRRRWSNMGGDFRKIKEYEYKLKDEKESFWFMRNDLRREKKLPGSFDKVVYDILYGNELKEGGSNGTGLDLDLVTEVQPGVLDSGRNVAAADGFFSDFEQSGQDGSGRPEKDIEMDNEAPASSDIHSPNPISVGNEKEVAFEEGLGSAPSGKKRKQFTLDEDEEAVHFQRQLIKTLERNGELLSSQLEAQNNFQLKMDQQKDHSNRLVAVLHKVADAMGKIADKL